MSEGGSGFLDKFKGVIKGSGKKAEEKWIPIDVDQAIKDKEEKDIPFKKVVEIKPVGGKGDSLFLGSFTPIDMPKADVVSGFTPIEMPVDESINDVDKSGLEGVVVGDNKKIIANETVISNSGKIVVGDNRKVIVEKHVKLGLEGVVIGNNEDIIKKDTGEGLISPELVGVLSRVPEEVPADFKDSLVKVAAWWTGLNRGDSEMIKNEEVRRFVLGMHMNIGVVYPGPTGLEKKWLTDESLLAEADALYPAEETEVYIKPLFVEWQKTNHLNKRETSSGEYRVRFKKTGDEAGPDEYKIYLRGKAAEEVLTNGQWQEVMSEDSENRPNLIKHLDNDLIMYFDKNSDPENAVKHYRDKGWSVSEACQDVYKINKEGSFSCVYSNESAKTAFESSYDSMGISMFEAYVNYCLRTGKKPDNPVLTAFVRSESDDKSVERKTRFPVVYSKEELRLKNGD